jgi:hypothetical protein
MGLNSKTFEQVEDDCVMMNRPPTTTSESNLVAPPRPSQLDTTPFILGSNAKSLRKNMDSHQLTMLVNTYNIHHQEIFKWTKEENYLYHTI